MAAPDAFELLGITRDATVDEVRAVRRTLAKQHHPDHGGDPERMQVINEAVDVALRLLGAVADTPDAVDERHSETGAGTRSSTSTGAGAATGSSGRRVGDDEVAAVRDAPSFTVEAPPVDCFEALAIVASWLGEVLDDDPPYRLDTYLHEPFDCWCGLEVVPDAGASTVSLTVAGIDGASAPDVIAVRDAWIANLNIVDWL